MTEDAVGLGMLGRRLHAHRERLNVTQAGLAEVTGMRKVDPADSDDNADGPDDTIRIWFSDGTPVTEFDGEMDEPTEFHDVGPLNYILSMLELSDEDCYSFVDSAGEPFWFRAADVALLAVPHHLVGQEGAEERSADVDDPS